MTSPYFGLHSSINLTVNFDVSFLYSSNEQADNLYYGWKQAPVRELVQCWTAFYLLCLTCGPGKSD